MRRSSQGVVRVDGRVLRSGDPRAAIAARSRTCPEDRLHTGVAPSLSIASNVVLKSYRGDATRAGPLLRLRAIRERARALIQPLRRAGAGARTSRRASFPGGNLQKVVLGREFSGRARAC